MWSKTSDLAWPEYFMGITGEIQHVWNRWDKKRQIQHSAWLECVMVKNFSFSIAGMCRGQKLQTRI
jgi:hypothetical protein